MAINIVGYDEYLTSDGDMFDRLALSYYNEEKMMAHIIQANPDYANVLIFEQGITLRIPILNNVETPETLPPWRRSE